MGKAIAYVGAVALNRLHGGTAQGSLNAGSGVNRVVFAIASGETSIYSSTYNAVGLTTWSELTIGGALGIHSVHRLTNPASGSNTFYVGMDFQGNQTAIGIVYQNIHPILLTESHKFAATTTIQAPVVRGQVISISDTGAFDEARTWTITAGSRTQRVSSYSTPADNQRLKVHDIFDGETASNTLTVTAGHLTGCASFIMNPVGGGGNQVIWAMIRKWQQFMDELRNPHTGYDHVLQREVLFYPSKLRTDMDPYIVQKRFRELVTGVPY